jgi:hypothetical protein
MKNPTDFKERIAQARLIQETCGCQGADKIYAGGGSYICKHFNFATVFPEYRPFWADVADPTKFAPKSNKVVSMKCKLECGTPAYPIKLSLYVRNLGCDGCNGYGRVTNILFEQCILAVPALKLRWSSENEEDPRNVCIRSNKEYRWKCVVHPNHGWDRTANGMFVSVSCPECPAPHSIPKDEALKRFTEAHGDLYEYDWDTYRIYSEKMSIICRKHGEFQQSARSHGSGRGCRVCVFGQEPENLGKGKIPFDIMLDRFREVWGSEYEYVESSYVDTQQPFTIICENHGEFNKAPFNHLNGQGCPTCRLVDVNDLLVKFKAVFGERYEYDIDSYINTTHFMTMICKTHGPFFKKPHHHIQGQGCPNCSLSKGMQDIMTYLNLSLFDYKLECWFDDLRGDAGRVFRFDIYIGSLRLIIEFDGKQHFQIVEWWGGARGYEKLVDSDKRKEKYLLDNKYNLIRIPFWYTIKDMITVLTHGISLIRSGFNVYISYDHYSKLNVADSYIKLNWKQ